MNPFRILGAIPILPAVGGWFTNRRNPRWRMCAPADVAVNASDTFYRWINRVPGGSIVLRDRGGRYAGSAKRLP
jgi:hypothetical protein